MMTSLDFYFDQATLDRANTYRNAGNDWAMYHTLSDAVKAGGGDAEIGEWVEECGGHPLRTRPRRTVYTYSDGSGRPQS